MSEQNRAFTLIELLVVISIIGLLISITLPALAAARQQVMMARELAASRQLAQAYIGYALEHRGRLLPGMADERATDGNGNIVNAPANERYPWRLAEYIGHAIDGSLLVNEQAGALATKPESMSLWMWQYQVSLYPSFGLNYQYLGGDILNKPASPRHIERMEHARRPSNMIVFGSARAETASGIVQGFFRITAPNDPSGYSANGWSQQFDEKQPAAWGYVDPRWSRQAIFAHLDGHSERLDETQMRDMTRWSNQAAAAGDPDWRPNSHP